MNHSINYENIDEEKGENEENEENEEIFLHPEEKTPEIFRIFVRWISPLVDLAYKRPINENDLQNSPSSFEISKLSERLLNEWKNECNRFQKDNNKQNKELKEDKPSLIRALFQVFKYDILRTGRLTFCFMVLQLLQPFLIGRLLDEISSENGTILSGFLAVLPLGLVAILSSASLINTMYHLRRTGLCIRGSMMMNIYSHALVLTNSSRQQNNIGTTANLMSIDSEKLVLAYFFIHYLWHAPITVLIVMGILASELGILTAFIGITFLLLVFPLQKKLAVLIGGYRRDTVKETDKRVNLINESLQAIRAIKFYAWEESITKNVLKVRAKEVEKLSKYLSINAVLRDLNYVNPAFTAMIIFIIYVSLGPYDVTNTSKKLTTGQVLSVLAYLNICRFPLNLLSQAMKAIADAKISINRLTDFFLLPTLKLRELDSNLNSNQIATIKLKNATFSWSSNNNNNNRSNNEVISPIINNTDNTINNSNSNNNNNNDNENNSYFTLKNISFNIQPGELIAIIGSVGAGKSTLISALLGEVPLINGEIHVNGSIAYAAQIPWIQNMSLKDNILFCSEKNDIKIQTLYNQALEQAALLPDISILPAGDKTEIGERGINLSGGQKSRVSLCRVLVASSISDIILLDDPFSAVDGATGNWMFHKGIMQGLAGKTRVVVLNSHLHLLRHFDRIIILEDGNISAIGSLSEILSNHMNLYQNIIGSIGKKNTNNIDNEDNDNNSDNESKDNNNNNEEEKEESIENNDNKQNFNNLQESSQNNNNNNYNNNNNNNNNKTLSLNLTPPTSPNSTNIKSDGKLIVKENRAIGSISWNSYISYFGAGFWDMNHIELISSKNTHVMTQGCFVLFAILFGFTVAQFVRVCIDIELLNWVSKGHSQFTSPYFIGYIVLIGILCFFVDIRARLQTYFAIQTSLKMHYMMLKKVMNAPIPLYFDIQTVGSLLNKFGKDLETIDVNIAEFFYQTCLQFFVLASVVLLCIWSIPLLILYFIPLFGVLVYVARKYAFVSRDLKRLESISRTPLYSSFSETLVGIETIRAFGVVPRFYSRHLSNMNHYQKFAYHSTMSQIWLTTRMEFGGCFILVGSSLLAVLAKQALEIEAVKVGLALVYSLQVTAMLQRNVQLFIELQTYFTSVERVMEYADIPQEESILHNNNNNNKINDKSEIDEELGGVSSIPMTISPTWPKCGQIEFRDVWMRYRPNTPEVLKGISFVVNGGQRVGICGRTGSGKSSTIQALFRIVEIFRGSILIDQLDIQSIPLSRLRSSLAIIPQDPVILHGDLRYQLDPFEEYSDEKIWNVLAKVNMDQVVQKMPMKLKELIIANGENLSQGQKQLLCIARALLREARILVMDEATSAVDQNTDDIIQNVLREETLQRGTTVLTIAHRLHTIVDFDKILVLGQGEVIEYDTPENLLSIKDSEFSRMLSDYHSLHSHSTIKK